jgi:hypothetical protein
MTVTMRLLVGLLLIARTLVAQTPTGVMTGSVRDETGRPCARPSWCSTPSSTNENSDGADGRFRIDRVTVGSHELQVVRIGFRPHRSIIMVPASGIDVSVTLEPAPLLLDTVAVRVSRTGVHGIVTTRGITLLPHEPRPLRGAIVEVLDSPHRTTTSRDGRFSFGSLGEGAYSLLVRLDRYQSRILSVYVPADSGVDVTVVLDSTIADWQRREDMELREISRRIREATNPSAFVSMTELAGPKGATLKDALRVAPSTLSRGLIVRDDVACVYIDGDPRPGMTVGDIVAADVQVVEVYGINAKGGTMAPRRPWLLGTFCGTGMRQGPFDRGEVIAGRRRRLDMDNWARVIVVWLKRGRGS